VKGAKDCLLSEQCLLCCVVLMLVLVSMRKRIKERTRVLYTKPEIKPEIFEGDEGANDER
jgi:hypothetical protein